MSERIMNDSPAIAEAVAAQRDFAAGLFDDLRALSIDEPGVTRDPYGEGENKAHRQFALVARECGFEVSTDFAANSFATLPGRDRAAPRIVIGSHLDSVPHGGNFDGAAGVVAGLTAMRALRSLGVEATCDLTTMAIRAEESMWFRVSYLGSRAALGTLPTSALDATRVDTGRTLADQMRECGADPECVARGDASLAPESVAAYAELHIEQAPSLLVDGLPMAVCTAVPGNFRYPNARVIGEYNHVGLPRRFRRDAVTGAVDVASYLDDVWQANEAAGRPMAVTIGQFFTDPEQHSLTHVPGEVRFSLDVRCYDEAQLASLEADLLDALADIEARRGVRIDLGPRTGVPVGTMAPELIAALTESARRQDVPSILLGSPGSHDAAAFAAAGVPTAMILLRNANGSHNPDEAMEIDDFMAGTTVLTDWLFNAVSDAASLR
ncbi:hydantoinase/carbamoylase family amidase [Acuticoccus sediminis]|uniref:hydantoinase/carbamoylase family amidase n=1 Tax=Acuticoccus sediminis TaxID=2184697 RepID=UPI001CFCED74|nr:hydantoinase/carbamoylase family amidase [Acuticoccus sediminis]